jgi:hypothetical protein
MESWKEGKSPADLQDENPPITVEELDVGGSPDPAPHMTEGLLLFFPNFRTTKPKNTPLLISQS